MEKIKLISKTNVDLKINLELTLSEAHALHNLTVYGFPAFKEMFYKNLGQHYLKPHEKGLGSLFETIKKEVPYRLREAEDIINTVKKWNKN